MDFLEIFIPTEIFVEIFQHFNGYLCSRKIRAIKRVCKLFAIIIRDTFYERFQSALGYNIWVFKTNNRFYTCHYIGDYGEILENTHSVNCPENIKIILN